MCRSLVFCNSGSKCPKCCFQSSCRDQTSKLLDKVGGSGCKSNSSSNPKRGLPSLLADPTQTCKKSHSHKLSCKSPQEQLPGGGIASAYNQGGEIQNGNPGNHQDFPSTRGVGHLNRLQRRLLPYTHTPEVTKISQISCPRSDLPVQSTTFWPLLRFCRLSIRPPVRTGPTYSGRVANPSGEDTDLPVQSTTFWPLLRFCGLSIRPPVQTGPTYSGPVANPSGEDTDPTVTAGLSGPAIHVLDRPVNSHRKAGSSRSTAYEAHTVASQKQLEGTRISGENYPITQVTTLSLKVVAGGRQCAPRATITPLKTCSANFYRRIKRRLGRSFKRTHCKRFLVSAGKQAAHKLSGTKSSLSSLKGVPGPLCKQYSASGHRQYNSGGLHKQRRRHEVRPTLCPAMENPDLVCQEASDTESPTHPGSAERGSRQAIQIRTDHSNGVVPPSAGIRSNMLQVAPASNRPLCHQIQQQATSLCVTLSRSPGLSSRCTQPNLGGSGSLCFSPNSHIGQGSR